MTRALLLCLAALAAAPLAAQNNAATGTPAVTAGGAALTGAPSEDVQLTADKGTIADADGITTFTPAWAWHEGGTADGDFTAIASATAATFTPLQAHVDRFIRVCATFDDDDGTSETACWTSSAAVANVNDAPAGGPAYLSEEGEYTPGNDNVHAHEGELIVMDVDLDPLRMPTLVDEDGISDPVFLWQWHRAPTESDAETLTDNDDPSASGWPIAGANSNTHTPTNADVGNILVACVHYIDDFGAAERACTSLEQTENANDPPTGRVAIQPNASQPLGMTAPARTNASFTTVVQGVRYTMADTTHGGTLGDADGLPTGTSRYAASDEGISWQYGTSADGPWTEAAFNKDSGTDANRFTVSATAAAAGWMRVCLFYEDERGTLEGGDSTSAATRALADSDSTCSPPAAVQNVNDAPVAQTALVNAPMGGNYAFALRDFAYTDADGDSLTHVIISELLLDGTNHGTLRLSSADVMVGQQIPVAQIEAGNLVWTPPPAAIANGQYSSLAFRVRDDGDEGADPAANRESNQASMTLGIVPAANTAASGSISITGTAAEDMALTISESITDPNGKNGQTYIYTWSRGRPMGPTRSAPGLTNEDAWATIAVITGDDGRTFTPGDAQVGDYIRLCVEFMDWGAPPSREGPFCAATAAAVTGVNDVPTSADISLQVPSHLSPTEVFVIRAHDLPWRDGDRGDRPTTIEITLPEDFKGELRSVDRSLVALAPGSVTSHVLPRSLSDDLFRYVLPDSAHRLGAYDDFTYLTFSLADQSGAATAAHRITFNLALAEQAPPTGAPQMGADNFNGLLFTEDARMRVHLFRGEHPDGLRDPNGIGETTIIWQQADSASGPWADIEGAGESTRFTPLQEHVGKWLRSCATFADRHQTPQTTGPHCSAGGQVANVDDAPVAGPEADVPTINVHETSPYIYTRANFPYTDEDGDELTHINIISTANLTAATGTLLWKGNAVATGDAIPVADIDNGLLTYRMADGAGTASGGTFTWGVRANGADSTGVNAVILARQSAPDVAGGDFKIGLESDGVAAIESGTLAEDEALILVLDTVVDLNGIMTGSERISWEVADPVTDGGTSSAPALGSADWSAVATATAKYVPFTPLQAHVGKYLRHCLRFTDALDNAEGPLCSTPLLVANTNDPATGRPAMDTGTPDFNRINEGDSIHIYTSVRQATIADEDGLPPWSTTPWRWSLQYTSDGGGSWVEKVTGTTRSTGTFIYTADATDLGRPIRACVFFDDATGNAEGGDATNADTRAASATLCSLAEVVHNVNDAPTGTLGAHDRAVAEGDALALDPTGLMDRDGATRATFRWQWQAAAPESMAAPDADSAAWADIPGATAASFTPDDAQVGQHIRGCVSYTDDQGTAERFCEAYDAAVTNTNDAPVAYDTTAFVPTDTDNIGRHQFLPIDFPYADEDGANDVASIQITEYPATGTLRNDMTVLTTGVANPSLTLSELGLGNLSYYPVAEATAAANYATFKYTVTDTAGEVSNAATVTIDLVGSGQQAARGAPSLTVQTGALYDEDVPMTASTRGLLDANGIDAATFTWQWQVADAADGAYSPIAGANAATFTPLQAQVGRFVRVCARFDDGDGNEEGPLCSVPTAAIANVDDAPVIADSVIRVPWTTDHDHPFQFSPEYFAFSDEDGDELQHITIIGLPTKGAFHVNRHGNDGHAHMHNPDDPVAEDDHHITDLITPIRVEAGEEMYGISWHPPDDVAAAAQQGYTSLTWVAYAGGMVSNTGTIRIDLIPPGPVEASGTPRIISALSMAQPGGDAVNEDSALAADMAGVTDPNGIDEMSIAWQWQQAVAPPNARPAYADFADIAGASQQEFTPTQAQVNHSIRVCVRFRDRTAPPTAEGPFCSYSYSVANVNDAPVSGDSEVFVQTIATADAPYTFSAADFPFTDDDAETTPALPNSTLASVTIVTESTTDGTFTAGGTAVADGTVVAADDLGTLIYYPPEGAEPADGYTTFTFSLSDGAASSAVHTMTINLVSPTQMAATGRPAIAGTLAQNATLTATQGTVRDPNGIDSASIEWQWLASATTSGTYTPMDGASGAEATQFIPAQAQVGMYLRLCMSFMDNFANAATGESEPGSERVCSSHYGPVTNVNDAPEAEDSEYQAARDGNSDTITIPASVFMAAYSDPDGAEDMLESVTITTPPDSADGILRFGSTPVTTPQPLPITGGDFMGGPLTFEIIAQNLQETSLDFTLSDGELDSDPATLTITFGKDIEEEQVNQVSAVLSVAAVTNATNAIGGAISSVPTPTAFDISMDGTSLMGAAQKLGQSNAADSPHHDWYLGTAPQWEHNATWNATDNSRASLLNRLNAMANGDIALNYSLTDTSTMRFWARYQSLDINGNEGESLEYDGSGTGFYLGADNQITETMRIGLAIGTDSSDISIDLDEDGTDDKATRSATSFYPYLHIDLGNNNNARVIAGFGSGTLDIKSTANSNSTASADLSWNMLAASISHHRQMKGALSARFDGSLQLGNTSTDETTFTNGSTLMAGKSSASELTINAELRYQSNNITPFASLATRKLGGDISQSVALDMAFGADLQTNPANLRIAITRQINDTTHQRHSISLDASTNPGASGVTASLGSRYDSITGRPQWQSTIGWQRRNLQTSLQASPGDYRLKARLHW